MFCQMGERSRLCNMLNSLRMGFFEGDKQVSPNGMQVDEARFSDRAQRGEPGETIPERTLSTLRISVADMESLHVRAVGSGNPVLPEFLYQHLPADAMSLMATIPSGLFAVSIPHRFAAGIGYPIRKSPPSNGNGFTIVYSRRTNGRYEVRHVIFASQEFGIAQFHDMAFRWVEETKGRLTIAPDRFGYFVPDQKMWGVILRDSGYTAFDPSLIPLDIAQVLPERPENPMNGNLVARIPIWRGDRQPPGDMLPVFTQIELTFDSGSGPQMSWIPFVEYQRARIVRSRPPDSIIPDFFEWLKRLTSESGFECWSFRQGMFFGDPIEWWGNQNRRRTEHEGIDFVEGMPPGAEICGIPVGTPVRAITEGDAVAVLDDFMNKTVVVRHAAIKNVQGEVFYTLYSHIRPISGRLGAVVKGQVLGFVERSTAVKVPAHLHLTGAWIPHTINPDEIRLHHIDPAFAPVALSDLNDLIRGAVFSTLQRNPD